jgi:superfamily II DNA or RNA helicase
MTYESLLSRKLSIANPVGISADIPEDWPLFPHQRALIVWAIRRGRCAIFADTGLGKTRMELAWAAIIHQHTSRPVLILAPLAVAAQTVREAALMSLQVTHCREMSDVSDGINITNYDRLHKFDPAAFGAIVLDESSIIKHHDAKSFRILTDSFAKTPYRLCATATPAPNDWTELGTHAEFLGICTRAEMLSEYFAHDGGDTSVWRLKGHARDVFWTWVASWGAMIQKPSDLGFEDAAYSLPPMMVNEHVVKGGITIPGMLFQTEASTLSERREARRASIDRRIEECASLVNSNDLPWVVWCDLNDESKSLAKAIHGAVEVTGSDAADIKEARLIDFAQGKARVLVSKPSICGWGLNWQHAANMAFVGVTDSYEAYYQAVRRCWRFGQKSPVNVHLFYSESEGAVTANLRRKEAEAASMSKSLSAQTHAAVMQHVFGSTRQSNPYFPNRKIKVPSFLGAPCIA